MNETVKIKDSKLCPLGLSNLVKNKLSYVNLKSATKLDLYLRLLHI